MDLGNIIVAVLGGGFLGSIAVIIANRKNTEADTVLKLSITVNNLNDDLETVRVARRKDRKYFENELTAMRKQFQEWADDIFDGTVLNIEYMKNNGMEPPYTPGPKLVFRGDALSSSQKED